MPFNADTGGLGSRLQRRCACGASSAQHATCENCRSGSSTLTIGPVNDPLEREADRVAAQVIAASDRRPPGKADVHVKPSAAQGAESPMAPPSVDRALADPGRPLEPALRANMERWFGSDFSRVRVHSDVKAERSARDANARAYTVGRDIVFGARQFAPHTLSGRRLIAHELSHVVQQGGTSKRLFRQSEEEDEEKKPPAAERALDVGAPLPAGSASTGPSSEGPPSAAPDTVKPNAGTPPPSATEPAGKSPSDATDATSQSAAAKVSAAGHAMPPAGMALCPDPPSRTLVVLACTTPPAAAPPAVEKAELPKPDPARFGGDPDRARFANELARCRAERTVKEEIENRYRTAVKSAKERATAEAKADTDAALKAATEAVEPPGDKAAIAKAKKDAIAKAKKDAAKKIADAQAAVTREDISAVTNELASKFEEQLAADFEKTIKGAFVRYGSSWLSQMQSALNRERKRIEKEKKAKPKVPKGQTPPPEKSADVINAEIEKEMTEVRCDQRVWGLNQLEDIAHGWAVGRREEVDFDTIPQKVASLGKFNPSYTPTADQLTDIPESIQQQKNMPGVAPEASEFLAKLAADPQTPAFTAGTYAGHGGGQWAGAGFSIDLALKGSHDQRGFWQHDAAVTFLLRLDATATSLGARWRVLYNDFRVAQEVNAVTGTRNVVFVGDSKGNLNWHGPLILHFHLDLDIPQKPPATGAPP
jgi:hypothetical protein